MTADRESCAQGEWQPGRLWSLWDMLEINVGELVDSALLLQQMIRVEREEPLADIDRDTRNILLEASERLLVYVERCDLKASNRALSRLGGNLQGDGEFSYQHFDEFAADLLLRLRDELELTKFVHIESGRIQFYDPTEPLFGQLVAANYPTAYLEVEEAGKCLALGRSTACVFHLMRTMEVGIRAIAQGLKIPDPVKPAEKNWGAILRKIREAIDARQRWRRKADKDFYEEALAHLDAVRNPWRNATMHVEKTYTEEEAENILYIVRAFMTKLASKIDENGKFV